MINNMFYNHVSSWIASYYNADSLEWMRRFIANSNEEDEIKERLLREVDRKMASLLNMPFFTHHDGMQLLMNEHCHPKVFTTRYAAMCEVTQLRVMGYDVRLLEGGVFFRIQLVRAAPINFVEPAEKVARAEEVYVQKRNMRLSA